MYRLNVVFHCGIDDTSLEKNYRENAIFVSSSLDEGYGRPAMEARLRGLRLVLSIFPVYRELHEGYASFFKPTDYRDLCAKILDASDSLTIPSDEKVPYNLIAVNTRTGGTNFHLRPRQAKLTRSNSDLCLICWMSFFASHKMSALFGEYAGNF